MKLIFLLLLVLAKAAGICLHAQSNPHVITQLTSTDGLPDDTVYDIYFDKAGWMWLATAAGVFRYDGIDFIPYRSSLAKHAEAHNFQVSERGDLYVANFRRQLFKVVADSLDVVLDLGLQRADFADFHIAPKHINSLVDEELLQTSLDSNKLISRRSLTVMCNGNEPGQLYGTKSSLALISNRNGRPLAILDGKDARMLPADKFEAISAVFVRNDSNLVIRNINSDSLAWQLLSTHGLNTWRVSTNPVSNQKIRASVRLASGEEVLAGNRGVFLLAHSGNWRRVSPPCDVSALAFDASGTLWASTLDQGVIAITATPPLITDYSNLSGAITGLAMTPAGKLLAATRTSELYQLDNTAHKIANGVESSVLWMHNNNVRYNTNVEINDSGKGLNIIRQLPSGVDSLNQLKSAISIDNEHYAFATIAGSYVVGPKRNTLFPGYENYINLTRLRRGRAYDVAYDAISTTLWTTYSDSLIGYNLNSTQRPILKGLTTPPTHVSVFSEPEKNSLLLGTSTQGLYRLSYNNSYSEQNLARIKSVRGNRIRDIIAADSYAYIITEVGIDRCGWNTQAREIMCEPVGSAYGLPDAVASALLVQSDTLIVAYGKQVYRVAIPNATDNNLADSFRQNSTLTVNFVSAKVAGVSYSLTPKSILKLTANTQPIALYPRIAAYANGARQRFKYRISNLDTAWHNITSLRPELYLATVPPGTHRVELALDEVGAPISYITIQANLVWWRRPWVYITLGLVIMTGLALISWRRTRQRTRLLRLEAELRRSRLTAIASQMNPHFIFNALNSIQEFILDQDPRSANTYLGRFARLMRLTLDHSRVDKVPLIAEIEAMKLYVDLERLRTDQTVKVDFDVDNQLSPQARIPPLLVQPFIENAFKHGLMHSERTDRKLVVSYKLSASNHLRVCVEDNGVGRVASAQIQTTPTGAGFAMSAIRQRIHLLNEAQPNYITFEVIDLYNNDLACGTRVEMLIQLNEANHAYPVSPSFDTVAHANKTAL